ncbi:MAG: bifunctional dihydroorotate dehydrogenase B NAD binding subunit/NADPH-dependent glutamate synthase [Oscillospiraceae bacterium]|jgi:glutamate synthase (NADPH/NADH) small chain|nr:bifunctional dihydroorotate dehydrogenase B NAD binding subunit/NADPH-dependent glutamate synthase [Oscillospiraceae bacterium]
MYKILTKQMLNDSVCRMDIEAPMVARKALAGQFIIFRVDDLGERVPLTVADYDREKGTVTIIFQIVGKSTYRLSQKEAGEYILDFAGPLGKASKLDDYKKVLVVGGGVGCAIAYPQAKALHGLGAQVDLIAGFRSKDIVILEDEMRAACDNLYVCTDDGSYGIPGFVTTQIQKLLDEGGKYDVVIAIGPVIMMKVICDLTAKYGVKTEVSLNPLMVDGTGMCGCCRVTVDGQVKFACVDGPDFDGHKVDFTELMKRNNVFRDIEAEDLKQAHSGSAPAARPPASEPEAAHVCNLTGEVRQPGERPKRNMSLRKVVMPEQNPDVRNKNFEEVSYGYTPEMAVEEARRCLGCKNKPCVSNCPVLIDIPAFILKIAEGDFEGAYKVISEASSLPAVCGRVCPQETQCEQTCVRGVKGEPVAIGRLERFAADWHMRQGASEVELPEQNGIKVAVIGAGPAGLTCAGDLAKRGYDVTVFETLHTPGGVLMYGIPEFRLPKAIVRKEIETLKKYNVDIETNMVIGKVLTVDELFAKGYKAVFIGSGAGLPSFMKIPGEASVGVYSANEYLTRVNLMSAFKENYDTPVPKSKSVAVVGGGNVAMDAARCAKRLGAEHVYIVYRRSEEEIPARREEIHHAKEEGIEFLLLNNPTEILADDKGHVNGMKCVRMELGEPDDSGRRRPKAVPGSEFLLDVDTVIIAIGTSPNPLIGSTTTNLERNKWGCIVADDNMKTTKEAVWAGGDAVTGAATVILAMGAGKTAAKAMHEYLTAKA